MYHAIFLRALNYGNYGIFLILGNAGFLSSAVRWILRCLKYSERIGSLLDTGIDQQYHHVVCCCVLADGHRQSVRYPESPKSVN